MCNGKIDSIPLYKLPQCIDLISLPNQTLPKASFKFLNCKMDKTTITTERHTRQSYSMDPPHLKKGPSYCSNSILKVNTKKISQTLNGYLSKQAQKLDLIHHSFPWSTYFGFGFCLFDWFWFLSF